MLRKTLLGLAVLFALFLAVASMQPEDFKLSRSATIRSPPAEVFTYVNDFHKWETWSPWAKMDPNMKTTYLGEAMGAGAAYAWAGDHTVGEGKMTILKSQAPESIVIQLDFLRPMAATNMCEFTFKQEGPGTVVTWSMSGKNNFIAKALHLVMNMDKVVGSDFEKGLAQLKSVAEVARK